MSKKIDIEAIVFMRMLGLVEEKNKEYSSVECPQNIAYIFDNTDDFKNYFISNSVENIGEDILALCKMRTTKKGSIIALKGLCDRTIYYYKLLHVSFNR